MGAMCYGPATRYAGKNNRLHRLVFDTGEVVIVQAPTKTQAKALALAHGRPGARLLKRSEQAAYEAGKGRK